MLWNGEIGKHIFDKLVTMCKYLVKLLLLKLSVAFVFSQNVCKCTLNPTNLWFGQKMEK